MKKNLTKLKIDLTDVCNFQCTYCRRRYQDKYVARYGSDKEWNEIKWKINQTVEVLNKFKKDEFYVFLQGGEIFLYDMKWIMDQFKNSSNVIRICFETNGSMKEEDYRYIVENGGEVLVTYHENYIDKNIILDKICKNCFTVVKLMIFEGCLLSNLKEIEETCIRNNIKIRCSEVMGRRAVESPELLYYLRRYKNSLKINDKEGFVEFFTNRIFLRKYSTGIKLFDKPITFNQKNYKKKLRNFIIIKRII